MVLGRRLDDSFVAEVRRNITVITLARLIANACYRFAPPFLAIIVRDFDVSLSEAGFALFVSELTGLASPLIGKFTDRVSHRTSMIVGLVGTAIGCAIAATSPSLFAFALGITVLVSTKQSFDIGLGAWIADHVPYHQRGRIVGLTETSWALGLLVGVSVMGIVTALTSWRVGYAVAIGSTMVITSVIWRRISPEPPSRNDGVTTIAGRITGRAWLAVLTMFFIMSSAQNLFVTFGSWLADDYNFGAAQLTIVGFSLGAVELFSSLFSANRTDRWGKERSIILGTALIVPGGVMLALGSDTLAIGLLGLGVYLLGFEFAVVSLLPIASDLVPDNPGMGLGWVLGAGAMGRAVMSLVSTRAYDIGGIALPGILGPALAMCGAASIYIYKRLGA
jgi:DHA1 family inner membrane transport protein